MAYDSQAHMMVVFGGLLPKAPPASVGDTWTFDGKQWKELAPAGKAPEARNSQVMAYDPIRRKTVLYGGGSFDGKTVTRYDDTWEWDGRAWQKVN
jgi:hypothetical protein